MNGIDDVLGGAIPGRKSGERAAASVAQEGRVISVTTKGAVIVLRANSTIKYGPAPWPLGAYATPAAAITAGHYPHVDDRVLVAFAGVDRTPWILGWWR